MRISQTLSILLFAGCALLVSTVVVGNSTTTLESSTNANVAANVTQNVDPIFLGTQKPTKGQAGLADGLKAEDFSLDPANAREPAAVKPEKKDNWAAQTSEGFQYKIRVKQQVSAVWVMKRNDHYDLVFANNTGSRMNVALPAEQFYALKNAAADLRTPASDVSRCRDQFIQLEVVQAKTKKTMAMCLNQKSKAADELRQFGSALTAYVR